MAVSKVSMSKEQLLLDAACKKQTDKVVQLIDAKADVGDAFIRAAKRGGGVALQVLLDAKVSPDTVDHSGTAAIHVAVARGNDTVTRLLIDNKANVNIPDGSSKRPIHFAATHEKDAMAKMLLDAKALVNIVDQSDSAAIHEAAVRGNAVVIRLLIGARAHVNIMNGSGVPPLYLAISKEKTEAVKELLNGKADLQLYSKSDDEEMQGFPIEITKNDKMTELLLRAGALPIHKQEHIMNALVKEELLRTVAFTQEGKTIQKTVLPFPTKSGGHILLFQLVADWAYHT